MFSYYFGNNTFFFSQLLVCTMYEELLRTYINVDITVNENIFLKNSNTVQFKVKYFRDNANVCCRKENVTGKPNFFIHKTAFAKLINQQQNVTI